MSWQVTRLVLRSQHPALWKHPHLIPLLLGMAEHAHPDGTAMCASAPTLASYIKRDLGTTKKQITLAKDLGLIAPGDQRLVAKYRGGRRPVVYNINMADLRKYPPPARGVVGDTARPRGVSSVTARGVVGDQNGVSWATPKPSMEPPKNHDSASQDQGQNHEPSRVDPQSSDLRVRGLTAAGRAETNPGIDALQSGQALHEYAVTTIALGDLDL